MPISHSPSVITRKIRRTDCEGQHWLHHGVMDAYKWRHTHDQHSLFIYIDAKHRGNHTPQTFYEAIRDAMAHMWCQELIKPTPSAGWFTLSSYTGYDDWVQPLPPRNRRRPRLVHSR